jgi:serine/threonine protein kinase
VQNVLLTRAADPNSGGSSVRGGGDDRSGSNSNGDSEGGGGGGDGGVLAKLADVGLARMLGDRSVSLRPGCGTPLYAAPEQLVNGACGLEADIFSLGWVLHGIATGQRLARRGEGRRLR